MSKAKLATVGDNSKLAELQAETLTEFAKFQHQIDRLKGKQKDCLNNGKAGGVLKKSVRDAYKELSESESQSQARNEVVQQKLELVAIGQTLSLFHKSSMGEE